MGISAAEKDMLKYAILRDIFLVLGKLKLEK